MVELGHNFGVGACLVELSWIFWPMSRPWIVDVHMPPFLRPLKSWEGDEKAILVGIPGCLSHVNPLGIVDLLKMVRQAEDIHLGDVMGILVGGSRDQGPV